MPFKCPIKKKEYQKEWEEKNKEKRSLQKVTWLASGENKELTATRGARFYRRNKERISEKVLLEKLTIWKLMGNKCACCGEDDPIYFQIDHVNNDGYLERKGKGRRTTLKRYMAAPHNYQLLCANCNQAKKLNGGKLYKPKKKKEVA
jgi:hypothetical protein